MALSARGENALVTFDGSFLIVDPIGIKGKLRQAFRSSVAAYRDPDVLLEELDGPKRDALLQALNNSSGVLSALLKAIREENEDLYDKASASAAEPLDSLLAALRINRRAVMAAVADHKPAIAQALRRDKDALAVLLHTYVPIEEIETVEVVRDKTLRITERGGEGHSVEFAEDHAAEFAALVAAVQERLPERPMDNQHRPARLGLDDLPKLRDLRDGGVITEREFEAKKQEILGLDDSA